MATGVIHAVRVTAAAVFDYEGCICPQKKYQWWRVLKKAGGNKAVAFEAAGRLEEPQIRLDKHGLEAEVAEYIGHLYAKGRIPWWGYLRADYEDEVTGKRLKLFIEKGVRLGTLQYWNIVGICLAADWNEDDEYDGYFRAWCKTELYEGDDVPKDHVDWVRRERWRIRLEKERRLRLWARIERIDERTKVAKKAYQKALLATRKYCTLQPTINLPKVA